MRLILDEEVSDVSVTSIGDAIDAGAAQAKDNGRLVVEVYVDGARWGDAELASAERLDESADEVRLVSANPTEMVRQTLLDALEVLSDADELQRESADLITDDRLPEAMEKLSAAFSIWQMVQEAALNGSRLAELSLDEVEADGVSMSEGVGRLNEHLTIIRNALITRDPIGLSDTLLYEFPPIIETWRALLAEMAKRVGRKREGTHG